MKMRICAFTCALLLLASMVHASEITVSAAASLTNAFAELQEKFKSKNPEVTVYTNFASSHNLLKQIEEGAPVDIFASADQITMDKAEASNLIDKNTRENFALNTLVLIVPFDAQSVPHAAKDLLHKDYARIAIGNVESVPAGRYTKDALDSENLWDKLKTRFVYAEHVRQVLDYVARGEVDAGFVYATDAVVQKEKVRIALTMGGHQPVVYPIAIVKNSKNQKVSQEFLDFMYSDEGIAILTKYGFAKP